MSRGDPSGHQGGGLRDEGDRLIEGAGAGSGVVVPGLPQGDAAGHHPGVVEGVQGLAGKNRNSRMPGFFWTLFRYPGILKGPTCRFFTLSFEFFLEF